MILIRAMHSPVCTAIGFIIASGFFSCAVHAQDIADEGIQPQSGFQFDWESSELEGENAKERDTFERSITDVVQAAELKRENERQAAIAKRKKERSEMLAERRRYDQALLKKLQDGMDNIDLSEYEPDMGAAISRGLGQGFSRASQRIRADQASKDAVRLREERAKNAQGLRQAGTAEALNERRREREQVRRARQDAARKRASELRWESIGGLDTPSSSSQGNRSTNSSRSSSGPGNSQSSVTGAVTSGLQIISTDRSAEERRKKDEMDRLVAQQEREQAERRRVEDARAAERKRERERAAADSKRANEQRAREYCAKKGMRWAGPQGPNAAVVIDGIRCVK
ncbi:MAG: hypothetical protein COA41_19985 [Sphingopyxis sp.]|nr:MAG: hypothetical protein COA41_19985 [Sphingopyxis sp.]